MKFGLLVMLLVALHLYGVEAVQGGNSVKATEQNSVTKTTVSKDGLVMVADKPVTQKCSKQLMNTEVCVPKQEVLKPHRTIIISVVGQGVAPVNTTSPAQAFALAKRAAIADAYRLIAEKVKGVEIEGEDLIKNMMVKRSSVRTSVYAMIRNANVVETTFRDGLCEVEMEIRLSYEDIMH